MADQIIRVKDSTGTVRDLATQLSDGTWGMRVDGEVNLTHIKGVSIDTNSGNKSSGTQRVILATDQPNLTTPLNVSVVAGATSGTEYLEGATDASIAGTAIMWEDTSDTLRAVSAVKPLPVSIISGSSSGTEYTEDAASAADPVGGMMMAVRKDALAAITSADGDNIAIRATNKGEIYVKHADAVSVDTELPAPAVLADGTANPTTTSVGALNMILNQSSSLWYRRANVAGAGDTNTGNGISATGGYMYNGATWDRVRGTTANGLDVDVTRVSGTVDVNIVGGSSAGTEYTEDAAAAANPEGGMTMAVRQDTLSAATVSADGDNIALRATNKGELYVKHTDSIPSTYPDLTVGPTSVTSATNIFSQDATGYKTVAVQVTSAGTSCTITYEQSNDNATWVACSGQAINATTAVPITTSTAVGIYVFPLTAKYFRARVSTYGSGTVTGLGYFIDSNNTVAGGLGVQAVIASGTVTTVTNITNQGMGADNAAFTDGTTRVMVGGYIFDEVAGTALTENDMAASRIDSKRAQVHVLEDATTRGQRAAISATGALKVEVEGGGTSGVQYTEGDIDATITGPAIMWEDTSDTLRAVSAAKPLPVNIVSGSASGTEYTEDAASAADPAGPMMMAVRKDTLAAITSADADNIAIRATNKGEIYVKQTDAVPVTDNGGSLTVDGTVSISGTVTVDSELPAAAAMADGAANPTAPAVAGFNMIWNGVAGTWMRAASASGQIDGIAGNGTAAVGLYGYNGATWDRLRTDTTNGLDVDVTRVQGTVTVDSELPAAAALADDTANPTTTSVGVFNMLFDGTTWDRAGNVNANGDAALGGRIAATGLYGYNGATWDRLRTDTTNGLDVDVTRVAGGSIAHDAADSGSPIKIGFKAESSLATATMVADADRTDATADLDGAQYTRPYSMGDVKSDATSNTDGASTASSVFTAVASTFNCITGFHVFRTDAGTTPIFIDFRDGTGGAVIWRAVIPAGGGSIMSPGPMPLFKTSANTALAYDVSAATSTVYINVTGFQSKV